MNDHNLLRYSRHLLLNEIGLDKQQKLQQSSVLCIGCGGLAAASLPYLLAAGVGKLIIADDDYIDLSNLQRQITYTEADIGSLKSQTMAKFLQSRNTDCEIIALNSRLDTVQLNQYALQCDVMMDCSDNYATRQAVNATAVATRKALVSASAIRFDGQLALYRTDLNNEPCYHCLFDSPDNNDGRCAILGVFSPLVGIMGAMQASETIKVLMGLPSQSGILHCYHALNNTWQNFHFHKNPQCPVCGINR